MIFNNSLSELFTLTELSEYANKLNEYVYKTFLRPNDLNINPLSLGWIKVNRELLTEFLKELEHIPLNSDLNNLFISLLNKNNFKINSEIILCSKTRFLSLLVGSLILGLLLELQDASSSFSTHFNL